MTEKQMIERIKDLEREREKLLKAIEALKFIAVENNDDGCLSSVAQEALKELEKE